MLHGWPQNWFLWRNVIGPLAASGYRVLAPDLRGFGSTEAPGSGYDGPTFARDQVALLDALGIEKTLRSRTRLGRLDRVPARPRPPRARARDGRLQRPPPLAAAEP